MPDIRKARFTRETNWSKQHGAHNVGMGSGVREGAREGFVGAYADRSAMQKRACEINPALCGKPRLHKKAPQEPVNWERGSASSAYRGEEVREGFTEYGPVDPRYAAPTEEDVSRYNNVLSDANMPAPDYKTELTGAAPYIHDADFDGYMTAKHYENKRRAAYWMDHANRTEEMPQPKPMPSPSSSGKPSTMDLVAFLAIGVLLIVAIDRMTWLAANVGMRQTIDILRDFIE